MGESDSPNDISEPTSDVADDPASKGDDYSLAPTVAPPIVDAEDPYGDNDFNLCWDLKTVTLSDVLTTLLATMVGLVIIVCLIPYVCDLD